MKRIGDWLQVQLKRHEMAAYHLAAKMGIATSVVNAWKEGFARPQNRNQFDASGNFIFSNSINSLNPRQYCMLQLP